MTKKQIPIGTIYQYGSTLIFFGNRNSSDESIKTHFPNLNLIRIKQTHGCQIVESNFQHEPAVEADAHYSTKKNLALGIATADCIPLFFWSPDSTIIAAIHSGWRGLVNHIVPSTIKKMNDLGCPTNEISIAIGPHIGFDSFQVNHDVAELILAAATLKTKSTHKVIDEKVKINLEEVLRLQMIHCGVSSPRVFSHKVDTFIDPLFHSYRRDGDKAGRQISFIATQEIIKS